MNQIGSFQFINLVKNRVPFILVTDKEDWTNDLNQEDLLHIKKNFWLVDPEMIREKNFKIMVDKVSESQYKSFAPIVIHCSSSQLAASIQNFFYKNKIENCYTVDPNS